MVFIVGSTPYSGWGGLLPIFDKMGCQRVDGTVVDDVYKKAFGSGVDYTDELLDKERLNGEISFDRLLDGELDEASSTRLIGSDNLNNALLLELLSKSHAETYFYLFYSDPITAVANALRRGIEPKKSLEQWKVCCRELLDFYRKNRRIAALVDVNHALLQPVLILDYCPSGNVGVNDEVSVDGISGDKDELSISDLIASQFIGDDSEIVQLVNELEASSAPLNDEVMQEFCKRKSVDSVVAEYRNNRIQLVRLNDEKQQFIQQQKADHVELAELTGGLGCLKEERDRLVSENELLMLQLHQVQEELEVNFSKGREVENKLSEVVNNQVVLQKDLATAGQLRAQEVTNSETALKAIKDKLLGEQGIVAEQTQENELLQLQLHQVQEELEITFLKGSEVEKELSEVVNNQVVLQKDLATAGQLRAQEVTNSETTLKAIKDKLLGEQGIVAEQTQENELLQLQLHQVQEELETTFFNGSEVRKELAALKESQTELQNELATVNRSQTSNSAAQEELDVVRDQLQAEQEKNKDQVQESQLLMLQLHQVQEELEHYYNEYLSLSDKLDPLALESSASNQAVIVIPGQPKEMPRDVFELFDGAWYRKQAGRNRNLQRHYLKTGWKNRLSPHPLFDPTYYINHNNLSELNYCPLIHFVAYGDSLGLSPHPLFDVDWYLSANPDVKASGANSLNHFLKFGAQEQRNPSPYFDVSWYLSTYPDVKESGINPLLHYLLFGGDELRNPSPRFNAEHYLFENPELRDSGENPLVHYVLKNH